MLLSPPHLVAVCSGDGKWYRRNREVEVDGPAPYAVEWYRRYLQDTQLPDWIFEGESVATQTDEGERPVVDIDPSYLQTRYPEPPQFPRLGNPPQLVSSHLARPSSTVLRVIFLPPMC